MIPALLNCLSAYLFAAPAVTRSLSSETLGTRRPSIHTRTDIASRVALAAPNRSSYPQETYSDFPVSEHVAATVSMTHHDIEAAEGLDGLVDEGLDVRLLGDVALDGNGLR